MPTKPIRRAKRPILKLPSLAAFTKLPLRKRTQLFAKWTAAKQGSYVFNDICGCALYQFGRAISRRTCSAGATNFSIPAKRIDVVDKHLVGVRPHTFAALTKRLNTHLGEIA